MTGFEQFCAIAAGIAAAALTGIAWASAWQARGTAACRDTADDDGE